jgi:hypothetical protein
MAKQGKMEKGIKQWTRMNQELSTHVVYTLVMYVQEPPQGRPLLIDRSTMEQHQRRFKDISKLAER